MTKNLVQTNLLEFPSDTEENQEPAQTQTHLTLKQARERYGIGRSTLGDRMKSLKVRSEQIGGVGYLNEEAIARLDALHEHYKAGYSFQTFETGVDEAIAAAAEEKKSDSIVPADLLSGFASSVKTMMEAVEVMTKMAEKPDSGFNNVTEKFEFLSRAKAEGWRLNTRQVADALGIKPATITGYGESFEMSGFSFSRVGKQGRSNAFSVS